MIVLAEINDFGEKIGGARKDLWSARGLNLSDLDVMNDAERAKYIKKDNVWKKPNYQKLMDDGLSRRVVYFMKVVRDSLPTGPYLTRNMDNESLAAAQNNYVSFVSTMRDAAMALRTEQDIAGFYNRMVKPHVHSTRSYYVDVDPELRGVITDKVLSIFKMESLPQLDRAIRRKQFGFTDDEKILDNYSFYQYDGKTVQLDEDRGHTRVAIKEPYGFSYFYPSESDLADRDKWQLNTWFAVRGSRILLNNVPDKDTLVAAVLAAEKDAKRLSAAQSQETRRSKFIPLQLSHIRFSGADFRGGAHMQGQDYMDTFKFRGGEYGNWMTERDRQASLDMGYEALAAMAKALNISTEDISLGGRLSIAFGARGQGAAMAHYEPMREVINLTKMHGAGSLAHEWGHAMDDILNKDNGGSLASPHRKGLCELQKTLHQHMQQKEVSVSPAEQEQLRGIKMEQLGKKADRIKRGIRAYFPSDDKLTPTQIATLDKLISNVMADKAATFGMYSTGFETKVDSVEALSDFRKQVYGRILPKSVRHDICSDVGFYHTAQEQAAEYKPETFTKITDYKTESAEFDKKYSREANGYWASECEMFARAFACYVHDKLTEAGIRCDYLVGHAEQGPVPHGDERRQLNADFDALIADFKDRGLLHDYQDMEYHAPEKVGEIEAGKEEVQTMQIVEQNDGQFCLDDLVSDATARASSAGRIATQSEHER